MKGYKSQIYEGMRASGCAIENFVTWEESCDRNPHPYPLKDHQYQTLEAIT